MSHIITLVAAGPELEPKHVAAVSEYLEEYQPGSVGAAHVLSVGKACDIAVSHAPAHERVRGLRELLAADHIDVFVNPAQGRRKKLLLADMESTIITGEMLDELAHEIGPEAKAKISELTARAMRGEMDFSAALQVRVAMLKGMAVDVLDAVKGRIRFNDGARTLVATMKAHGATCAIVTGGFTDFAEHVAAAAGFDASHANVLEWADGRLTGQVVPPVLDKGAKLGFLRQYIKDHKLAPAETLAIGDGANDLPMLQVAGLGIGFRPKPLLLGALDNCIVHGDLTAALYAQGFLESEIVAVRD